MSFPPSWVDAYREQKSLADLLNSELKSHLSKVPSTWYASSRIKEPLSFYQKVESGVIDKMTALEDFVAAMIVVPLPGDIPEALGFVDKFYETRYRRPKSDRVASGRATEFVFNDIRLYGTLRVDPSLPEPPTSRVVFEIQIKTFFQHAWSSATHDLVYKNPKFSWSRSRVAAQLRAVLENAELSMVAIDELEHKPPVARIGEPERTQNKLLDVVMRNWAEGDLPPDRRRMTQTLFSLCQEFKFSPDDLERLLERGRVEFGGHPDGWSPYQVVMDYSSRYHPDKTHAILTSTKRRLRVVHVTADILSRLGLSVDQCVGCEL